MNNRDALWVEVWIDSVSLDYLLFLRLTKEGLYEVADPQKANKVDSVFQQYEDAVDALTEDEFSLIEGRYKNYWLED